MCSFCVIYAELKVYLNFRVHFKNKCSYISTTNIWDFPVINYYTFSS